MTWTWVGKLCVISFRALLCPTPESRRQFLSSGHWGAVVSRPNGRWPPESFVQIPWQPQRPRAVHQSFCRPHEPLEGKERTSCDSNAHASPFMNKADPPQGSLCGVACSWYRLCFSFCWGDWIFLHGEAQKLVNIFLLLKAETWYK